MKEPFTQAGPRMKVLTADENAAGRIDAWIAGAVDGDLSRSRIKALILEGAVSIGGAAVTEAKHRIKPGDIVEINLPEPEEANPAPEDIPIDVLHEDDDVIVVSKPAGLVVHPGAGNASGTLVNALIHHCGQSLSGIGGVRRPGIVHRLDKNTSGVMVVAKNDAAHRRLSEQFADHGRSGALKRAYLAYVWGTPAPLKGVVDAPLGRASSDRTKREVKRTLSADSRHAVTHYSVVERFGDNSDAIASLVECRLETGRTHQIRVHMAHIGHPVIGDSEYGSAYLTKANLLPAETAAIVRGLGRQALHAYLLEFEHPKTGELMHFEAPLPPDLERLGDSLLAAGRINAS
ncbi:MAG: pseudouridine synthase [Rhizobiaceae bacterium MnEN-MB40S]|nr:MAG: pseudouridine synthase [Rhizobiaceae bacterium MnEN-MB40S]